MRLNIPPSLFVKCYVLMVALAMGLGGVILAGGRERFTADDTWSSARALVGWLPVAPYMVWGVLFFIGGIAMVATMGRSSAVLALRVGLVIYVFLALALGVAAASHSDVSWAHSVIYGVAGILHLTLSDHLARRGWTEQ